MSINVSLLAQELEQAGISIGGLNSSGIVWDTDGETEIQDRSDVVAVLDDHDPEGLTKEEQAKTNAKSNANIHNGSDVKNLGVPDLNDVIRVLCAEHGLVDENGIIDLSGGA